MRRMGKGGKGVRHLVKGANHERQESVEHDDADEKLKGHKKHDRGHVVPAVIHLVHVHAEALHTIMGELKRSGPNQCTQVP